MIKLGVPFQAKVMAHVQERDWVVITEDGAELICIVRFTPKTAPAEGDIVYISPQSICADGMTVVSLYDALLHRP